MNREQILDICIQSTELAKDVQPLIEKQSACRRRATEVSDQLASLNLIPWEKRAEVERDLNDPEYAYELIVKLARQIGPASLGEPGEKRASTEGMTADEKFLDWIENS